MRCTTHIEGWLMSLWEHSITERSKRITEIRVRGRNSEGWKRINITSTFKKFSPSLTSTPRKGIEKINLKDIAKQWRDKNVFGHGKHEYMEGKLCLTNLLAFHNEHADPVDKARTLNIAYLDFNIVSVTALHCLLPDKLMKHKIDEWRVRQTENWLYCWPKKVVDQQHQVHRRPVIKGTHQVSI